MTEIKALFFDLDQTLGNDRESNQRSLSEVMPMIRETFPHLDESIFTHIFFKTNNAHWGNYDESPIGSMKDPVEVRTHIFEDSFKHLDLSPNNGFSASLAKIFQETRAKTYRCFEDTLPVLQTLQGKIPMVLVTNGNSIMQRLKLEVCNLNPYLQHIFIAQEVGESKPKPTIFRQALQAVQLQPHEVLMVGDNPEKDIFGAKSVGLQTAWIIRNEPKKSPFPKPDYTFENLSPLKDFL